MPLGLLLVVSLVCCSCLGAEALERKSRCLPARDHEMDQCAARMGFLGDHSFRVPNNVSAMGSFCQNLKNSITCIQSYSRDCLQGFTKQILTSLLKRGKQQYNMICQNDEAKGEFLTRMNCLLGDKIEQLHTCMDASVARFEFIRSNVPAENRLPSLCCSYQVFNRDLDTTMDKVCGPKGSSGDKSIHAFMHKIVSGTTGEFFQLVCDNHRTMAECQASSKTKDTLRRLEQVTRSVRQGKTKPQAKSLVPVLLDILASSEQR